jgi:prepilin-type N-terminal cleavage/methylation domain-containing protein
MLNNKPKKTISGFTIIEVLIVLAIISLIMVIVFYAVPELQRSHRDAVRKDTVNRVKEELLNYSLANSNQFPFNHDVPASLCPCTSPPYASYQWADFYTRYLKGNLRMKDPSTGKDVIDGTLNINLGTPYNFSTDGSTPWSPYQNGTSTIRPGDFFIIKGSTCNNGSGNGLLIGNSDTGAASKHFSMLIGLDRPGTYYCVDNGTP